MRKLLYSVAACSLLFSSSCKKDDKKDDPVAVNTWTFNGENNTKVLEASHATIISYASKDASISFVFKTLPVADGDYTITEQRKSDQMAENELYILAYSSTMVGGESKNNNGKTAAVQVSSGKIRIKCNAVPMLTTEGATTQLSADLAQ